MYIYSWGKQLPSQLQWNNCVAGSLRRSQSPTLKTILGLISPETYVQPKYLQILTSTSLTA